MINPLKVLKKKTAIGKYFVKQERLKPNRDYIDSNAKMIYVHRTRYLFIY